MTSLIDIRNIYKHFKFKKKKLHVLDDLSLSIFSNETLGLVGESGCGKSTLGKILLGLTPPTSGSVYFENNLLVDPKNAFPFRKRPDLQMIFQDPFSSLNPRMTARDIIGEPLEIHHLFKDTQEKKRRINQLLDLVGLTSFQGGSYPHELSGGQRQRVGIARAIALNPKFIVCDEPLAALDVSIQAQIIHLLLSLQKQLQLTYLFISHDLAVVRYISNRVAVMYLGQIVEMGRKEQIYNSPAHPYTQALFSAIPIPDPYLEKKRSRIVLSGEIPSPFDKPKGCVFCQRCPKAMEICKIVPPPSKEISPGHTASCHLFT